MAKVGMKGHKMRKTLSTGLVIAALSMGIHARPAFAKPPNCCPESTIWVATIGSQLTAFVEGYIAQTYVILTNGFAGINAQVVANTQSIVEVVNYQTQTRADLLRQKETKKREGKTEMPPSYALTASATTALATAQNISRINNHNLAVAGTIFHRNLSPDSNSSGSANAIRLVNNHLQKYCDDLDASLGLCTAVDESVRGRDTKATTVLNNDVLDGREFEDAQNFQKTIMGPAAPILGRNDLRTTAGLAKQREKNVHDARKTTASAIFDYLIAMRSPIKDSELQKWLKDLYNTTYGIDPNDPDQTSLYELVRLLSTYRFYNAGWIGAITQQKNDVVVTKEWVLVRSQRLYLDWQRQKLKQLLAAAVAAGNATDAETAYQAYVKTH